METKIFDYGINGEGVAKIDGKIALIPYALLGEKVDTQIERDYKNYCTATLKEILTPSKERRTPPCPYFYSCGGCALQHMAYAEQLKFKTALVKKTIKKIANLDCDVDACVASDLQYEYRNKASFVFNNSFGFYKLNSKNTIKIDNCQIVSKNINKVLNLAQLYLKNCDCKDIKNLVVRDIENQILVGVVARKKIEIGNFCTILCQNFKKIGVFLIINNRNDAVVLTKNCHHLAGIKNIEINNFNLHYAVDILGFHQTNINVQNKIYNYVLNLVDSSNAHTKRNIINGFSGAGLLSAILSHHAKNVYGIEIEKSSHESAERLKRENKILNLTNILGDFNLEISKLKDRCDLLVLDPSKKGLGGCVEKLVGIKEIIYISCNPIALAKDLRYLKKYYIIENIKPFDMFPNTTSVETIIKLKLKEN